MTTFETDSSVESRWFSPIYKTNSLILGNPESTVGIVTLWTLRAKIAAKLDPAHYAAIGQLYSPTRGIDYLVRNLLANPSIRHIIVTGQDLSGSGRALRALFEEGVYRGETSLGTSCWRVPCDIESFVDLDIPLEAIDALRANVKLVVGDDREHLPRLVQTLAELRLPPWGEPRLYEKKEAETSAAVAENAVFVVRGERVADTWVQILHAIWTHGHVTDTHYDSRQKEILDLVSIVKSEDPSDFFVPEYLPCNRTHLEAYLPTVLTSDPPALSGGASKQDLRYTYGMRLRSYFEVDQVADVIAKLVRERDSRSAAMSLWDPRNDHRLGGSPCLNHIWARIVGDTLNLTAVIRSNDMYKAWPENAFALRAMQEMIRGEVERLSGEPVRMGELMIMSESAHIYDDDWDNTEHIIARQYGELAAKLRERRDPRGNYLIEIDEGVIRVERLAPSGEHVGYYYGNSALALIKQIAHDSAVSYVEHALYLGSELQKAEQALKNPGYFTYVQDQPLEKA